jgi:hypothetical protein
MKRLIKNDEHPTMDDDEQGRRWIGRLQWLLRRSQTVCFRSHVAGGKAAVAGQKAGGTAQCSVRCVAEETRIDEC